MSIFIFTTSFFLFFSSGFLQASPTGLDPSLNKNAAVQEKNKEEVELNPSPQMQFMDIGKPKIEEKKFRIIPQDKFFYAHRHGMIPYLGYLRGIVGDKGQMQAQSMGLSYWFVDRFQKQKEIGFSLYKNEGFFYGYSIYPFQSSGRFRSFSRLGLGARVVGEQGMATFLKYDNYHGRLGLGAEWTLLDPMSFRLDGDVVMGFNQTFYLVNLGYIWAW